MCEITVFVSDMLLLSGAVTADGQGGSGTGGRGLSPGALPQSV